MVNKNIKKKAHKNISFEDQIFVIFKLFLYVVFFVFVVANTYISQVMPSELSNFFKKDISTFAEIVDKTQKTKYFAYLYSEIKENISSNSNIIFASFEKRREDINLLEEYLVKSPKSPNIEGALSILYKQQGNSLKFLELFTRSTEKDPELTKILMWTRGDLNP